MGLLRNIIILTIGRAVNVLASIIFLPYLARSFTVEAYGNYGQTLLVVDTTTTLFSGGLASILLVFLARERNNYTGTISSNLLIALGMGIIAYAGIYFGSGAISDFFENPSLREYLPLYGAAVILGLLNSTLSTLMVFYKKVKQYTLIVTCTNILKLGLLFIAIQFFESMALVFGSLILILLIQMLAYLTVVGSRIRVGAGDVKQGLSQLKLGIPLSATSILGYLVLSSDGAMVSYMHGVEDYATYRIGAMEVPFLSTIYLSIAQIILPRVTQLLPLGKYKEIASMKRIVAENSAAIIYPVCIYLVCFSREFVELYFSEKYAASSLIFAVFNLTLLMRINDYLDVMIADGKTRIIAWIHLFIFILNLGLNYLFIILFGIEGAAIATVVSLFTYSGICLYHTGRSLKLPLLDFFNVWRIGKVLLISAIVLAPFVLVVHWVEMPIYYRLISLIYLPIIYIIFMRTGMFHEKIRMVIYNKTPAPEGIKKALLG